MAQLPRLFIPPDRFDRLAPVSGGPDATADGPAPPPLTLSGAEHHYLSRVLRARPGDAVLLLDGQGRTARATVASIGAAELALVPDATTASPKSPAATAAATPSGPRLHLYVGLLKGDKLDLVVQKATELGAHRIVLVACARSVPRLDEERADRRQQRYARIAQAAAQQCRRLDVPEVLPALRLPEALALPAPDPDAGPRARLLLYEGAAPPLHTALPRTGPPPAAVELFVGPEGGFDPAEVAAALAAGFVPCSLGPRILRAETAALAALAVLAYTLQADAHPLPPAPTP